LIFAGKFLEAFEPKDILFICCSRLGVIPFAYHMLSFALGSPLVSRGIESVGFLNTVVAIPVLFLVYDAVYQPFHRILHLPFFYPYVHKHHHRQMVPSRGNLDAVNVHPFEYMTGEYMHLFAVWFTTTYIINVHLFAILTFIILGGFIATLNHTRLNILWPGVVGVAYHDIHHSVSPFQKNYSQYSMFWDRFYGTFQHAKDPA
jgi:sterol desaturase/sphingolipid hydroxylase (fatty acid hydroxylase superfamily)